MEENNGLEQITYSNKRKFWFELKDIFAGVAFPFILMIILSSTIIAFAGYGDDVAVNVVAVAGGEIMLIAAFVVFGRANGSAAYRKHIQNEQKRSLGSTDETAVYHTGEYAIWKGLTIGFICCVPFIIFQVIELCAPNTFTAFCLRYVCAWAFYPFSYLGESFQALNFIMIIVPVAAHTVGYYIGKRKEIKIQKKLEETNVKPEKGRKK